MMSAPNNELPVSIWFYLCFLNLGIEENGESNCDNSELVYQVKSAIPEGYTKSVFCAENTVNEVATCKGDSGKYVLVLCHVWTGQK